MTSASGVTRVETRGGSFEDGIANGLRLLEQHPEVALRQAQTLLRLNPEPRAFELAASALRRMGKPVEAEQAELSAIKASFAIRDLDRAAVTADDGRIDESRAMIGRFLHQRPDNLLAMTMAAELDIEGWKLEAAEPLLRRVLNRAPSFLRAIMLLAKCLTQQARLQEAAVVLEEVVARKPKNITALRNLGQLYAEANQLEKAAEVEARALEIDPRLLDMWIVYAQHLRMLGRKDDAKGAFGRALELDPNNGAAWWGLTNYFTADITDAEANAIKRALEDISDNVHESGALHIALAIIEERSGNYADAFSHFEQGKKLRRKAHPYDELEFSSKIDGLVRVFTPDRLREPDVAGCPDNSPIFIIGMPRSGTTLLERILSRHSQIEAGGELPIMPRLEERLSHGAKDRFAEQIASMTVDQQTQLGRWYVERSQDYRVSNKPRFIDKLNFNWSRVGLIRLMLPNARIIDLRRDAVDCCWSNFKMMFAEGHMAANDQRDMARFYRDYVRLLETVDATLPGGILKIRYEDLVEDTKGQARKILDFLGLEYEPACIDFHLSTSAVATPSSEQVRRPINRDSIGASLPYRQWLGPMIEELGELATNE